MERETTIKKLFHEEGIKFSIPSYQRAYSWEVDDDKKQIKQFLIDLKEQIELQVQNPKKRYFLGHFLFEKDSLEESRYWVIDGQQRLTTVVIFMSCLIGELERREANGENNNAHDEPIEIWRLRELYIKYGRYYKFQSVRCDNSFFISNILEGNSSISANTSSSKRMVNAKKEFEKFLEDQNYSNILILKDVINDAIITTFEVKDKIQATQIFAFQNDRGKDLTTLEKLKAYLMHKIYAVSNNHNPEDRIRDLESIFSDIYSSAERISLNEDSVLGYHSIAFLRGSKSPMENVKDEINDIKDNEQKEKWIINFALLLKESFLNIEMIDMMEETNCYVADCLILDKYNSYPLILKVMCLHKEDNEFLESVAKAMESILFKLNFKLADYRTIGLHSIAKNYKSNKALLSAELSEKSIKGFQWWWNFNGSCLAYFESSFHYHSKTKYVLWKYENWMREKERKQLITPAEYKNMYDAKRKESTLDHITPQDPNFTTYSEEFKQKYLNNIGNLSLMVWGDNSEKRNNNPVEFIHLYDGTYLSHKEIRDVLLQNQQWGETEISQRAEKMRSFIIAEWQLL